MAANDGVPVSQRRRHPTADSLPMAANDLLPDAQRRYPRTLGSDETSPTLCDTIWTIHGQALNEMIIAEVEVRCEVWNHKMYLGLYYHPRPAFRSGRTIPALQLDEWHSTLVVGYWPRDRGIAAFREVRDVRLLFEYWRRVVEAGRVGHVIGEVWRLTAPPNPIHVQLVAPPWRNSVNFGIAQEQADIICAVRGVAEAVIRARRLH